MPKKKQAYRCKKSGCLENSREIVSGKLSPAFGEKKTAPQAGSQKEKKTTARRKSRSDRSIAGQHQMGSGEGRKSEALLSKRTKGDVAKKREKDVDCEIRKNGKCPTPPLIQKKLAAKEGKHRKQPAGRGNPRDGATKD